MREQSIAPLSIVILNIAKRLETNQLDLMVEKISRKSIYENIIRELDPNLNFVFNPSKTRIETRDLSIRCVSETRSAYNNLTGKSESIAWASCFEFLDIDKVISGDRDIQAYEKLSYFHKRLSNYFVIEFFRQNFSQSMQALFAYRLEEEITEPDSYQQQVGLDLIKALKDTFGISLNITDITVNIPMLFMPDNRIKFESLIDFIKFFYTVDLQSLKDKIIKACIKDSPHLSELKASERDTIVRQITDTFSINPTSVFWAINITFSVDYSKFAAHPEMLSESAIKRFFLHDHTVIDKEEKDADLMLDFGDMLKSLNDAKKEMQGLAVKSKEFEFSELSNRSNLKKDGKKLSNQEVDLYVLATKCIKNAYIEMSYRFSEQNPIEFNDTEKHIITNLPTSTSFSLRDTYVPCDIMHDAIYDIDKILEQGANANIPAEDEGYVEQAIIKFITGNKPDENSTMLLDYFTHRLKVHQSIYNDSNVTLVKDVNAVAASAVKENEQEQTLQHPMPISNKTLIVMRLCINALVELLYDISKKESLYNGPNDIVKFKQWLYQNYDMCNIGITYMAKRLHNLALTTPITVSEEEEFINNEIECGLLTEEALKEKGFTSAQIDSALETLAFYPKQLPFFKEIVAISLITNDTNSDINKILGITEDTTKANKTKAIEPKAINLYDANIVVSTPPVH